MKIEVSEAELAELFDALNKDQVSKIAGGYSTGWADGAQGFIEIQTVKGRRYAWLDNYFDPVANTYAFCNRIILPKVAKAKVEAKNVNPQEEYKRVFDPPKTPQGN